eukprot:8177007-Lingulodinium_polyedra.AAC.1
MNSDVEYHQPRIHIVEPATTYRTMPSASPNGGEANGAAVTSPQGGGPTFVPPSVESDVEADSEDFAELAAERWTEV